MACRMQEVVSASVKLVKSGRIPARSGAFLHLMVDTSTELGGFTSNLYSCTSS